MNALKFILGCCVMAVGLVYVMRWPITITLVFLIIGEMLGAQ